jgi:ketosteroid isomerase-like protein
MPQENVELTHRVFDAFNRRDLDAVIELMDPEVEAISRLLEVEGGSFHGHDGMRAWWETLVGIFPDFKIEVEKIRGRGDLTIAVLHNRGHGSGSDAPLDEKIWMVVEWRNGKCVWWRACRSEDEALEAAAART